MTTLRSGMRQMAARSRRIKKAGHSGAQEAAREKCLFWWPFTRLWSRYGPFCRIALRRMLHEESKSVMEGS